MALVDLRKINGAYTPVYNTTWGYFSFAQTINLEYNQAGLYRTYGEFQIDGVFVPASGSTDEEKFLSVQTFYDNLAALFTTCINSDAPSDLTLAGTSSDQRCVALPNPLLSSVSGVVYAKPISLDIAETQWPSMIQYSAVLQESEQIKAEVTIDSIALSNATITIDLESPRLTPQRYAFANSEELFFNGWNPRSFNITGTMPIPSGYLAGSALASSTIQTMVNNLMDGRVDIGIKTGASTSTIFADLFLDQSNVNIEKTSSSEGFPVNITARY